MIDLNRAAARRATLATVVVVALFLVGQSVVTAAVTSGQQPLAATDQLPQTADSDHWADAPSRTVSLSKQQMAIPHGGGSVDELQVQALTNETHVAFRLTWEDPTNDTTLRAPGNYSDAAAIMLHSGEQPPITMGATGTPVDIWYWRAQWQYGAADRSEWGGDMYAYPHPDAETKPGLAADNPLSKDRYDDYGQNYYAAGYGSLSHAPTQTVDARGTRAGDEWSVVFVREHTTDGEYDATFRQNETMYLAFAVWNGSTDEVNGKKSLTLRFTTLDTGSGELAAADPATDGDSGSTGGSTSGGASSGSSATGELLRSIGTLVAIAALSWTLAYWRVVR
ncbi:ethylbenzene dehydrogenase-related protein [Haloarchaeobius sp. DYHT-AS-18]|uniref:ethylbenzene dehydrogenase-related protein n=1 Tax=Haloarchaeobius sp. DYHT-AS-18 TaxID=3446117 RepID=UPI003EB9CBB2